MNCDKKQQLQVVWPHFSITFCQFGQFLPKTKFDKFDYIILKMYIKNQSDISVEKV